MRANDFLTEDSQRDQMYDQVATKLEKAGYTELGSGAEAIVWTKDSGSVIKIILPEDETNNQAVNTFKLFVDFCISNSKYSNLPRIKQIEDTSTKFLKELGLTFVTMERLQPIKNGSFEEAMIWILSDLSANNITWNQAWRQINDERTWESYSEMAPESILRILDDLDPKDKLEYEILFKLMTVLYHKGRINKMGWDLHTENVMQRSDGTLVIVDPWFSEEVL